MYLLIPDCQPPARAFLSTGCYLFEPLGPRNFKAATNFCRENGAEVNFANEESFAINQCLLYGMDDIKQQQ